MRRLFIALPVEQDKTLLEPANRIFKKHPEELKIVEPCNYHITLKFLGNTDNERIKEIINAFQKIDTPAISVPWTLKGIGAFPSEKKPSIIWCGIETQTDIINNLFHYIEKFARQFGFKKEERNFTPHLTLARIRKKINICEEIKTFIVQNNQTIYGSHQFNRIELYESTLTSQGAVYSIIETNTFA